MAIGGVPSIPRQGLPVMVEEGTAIVRDQLYYDSPFAAGKYIIRGGTIRNDLGATIVDGFPEGYLLSYNTTLNRYLPWQTGDDTGTAAVGVLRDGKREDLIDDEEFLSTVIIAASGGLRMAALKYDNSDVVTAVTATETALFLTDFNAATNVSSIGAFSRSTELDPDAATPGEVVFYG